MVRGFQEGLIKDGDGAVSVLSNRETATAIWAVVFFAWMLSQANIRASLADLVKTALHPKILAWVVLAAAYTVGLVFVLKVAGLWTPPLLKDTVIWFVFNGLVLCSTFITGKEDDQLLRKVWKDSIKLIIVLEFLVSEYTFSLVGELVFLPIMTVVVMMDVVARNDEKFSVVAKLTSGLQAFAGVVIVSFAVVGAIMDFGHLQSYETFAKIALAPLLSLLFVPYVYVLLVVARYELILLKLHLGPDKEKAVVRYATAKTILHCGLNLRRINGFLRSTAVQLIWVKTRADVDRVFTDQQRGDLALQ